MIKAECIRTLSFIHRLVLKCTENKVRIVSVASMCTLANLEKDLLCVTQTGRDRFYVGEGIIEPNLPRHSTSHRWSWESDPP